MTSLNNTVVQSLIALKTITKDLFWECTTCQFPIALCVKFLPFLKRELDTLGLGHVCFVIKN